MIITRRENTLLVEGLNDVELFMKKIPGEIDNRVAKLSATITVAVIWEVDGVYTRNVPFNRHPSDAAVDKQAVQTALKLPDDSFATNSIRVDQVFSVRATVRLNYEKIGEITGKKVAADFRKFLDALKATGMNVREPPPQD